MKTKKDEKLETLSLGRIEDLIRQIFTEIIKSIRKLKMKALKQNKYLHVEKITPNYKYGFRAECEYDIIKFQNNLIYF